MLKVQSKIQAVYDEIFERGRMALQRDETHLDVFLNQPLSDDTRFGLTLLIPVQDPVTVAVAAAQKELAALAPEQYFYPATDLHVTVLSLLTARSDRRYVADQILPYQVLVAEAVARQKSFVIAFAGLSLSPAAVLAQGFPEEGLLGLRQFLREQAAKNKLLLDERYHSPTAHVTLGRWRQPLLNSSVIINWVEQNRQRPLATMSVTELHLVWHDWYNRQERRQVLARFPLT